MMEMVVRMMEEQGGNCVPDKVVSNGTNSQVRIEKKRGLTVGLLVLGRPVFSC